MGCNCCRILQSCMFEQEEPQLNTCIVDVHSYTGHGHSNSQTIKIGDLKNEGYISTERDGYNESQDVDSITKNNNVINDDATSTATSTLTSSYPVLYQSLREETKEQDSSPLNHHGLENSDCPVEESHHDPGSTEGYDASGMPDETSIVAQMIIKHSLRSVKKETLIANHCNGMLPEEDNNDDNSRDVAEALAILDAVIAEFEDDSVNG